MTITKKETCYDAPQVEVMELYVEGVLCQSTPEVGREEEGEFVPTV